MSNEGLALLDARRHRGRNVDHMIGLIQRTGVRPDDGNGGNAFSPTSFQRFDDVLGAPRSGDTDENIPRTSLGFHLPGEQPVKAIVIADGRNDGRK